MTTATPSISRFMFDKSSHIALMDQQGNWRSVPANSNNFPITIRITISPELAAEILTERNIQNRSLDKRQVSRYVNEMVNGRWRVHGNGIQFDKTGRLIDGQHRLQAIVESGLSQAFMVTFGVEPDAIVTIDEGRRRSNFDVASIAGIEVSRLSLSTASYILEERGDRTKTSRTQVLNFAEIHKEALAFVCDDIRATGFTKAPIAAVLVRAYYSCKTDPDKLDRLKRFIKLLQLSPLEIAGEVIPAEDQAPLVLNGFVSRSSGKNNGSFRKELYDKTKAAVYNFMERIEITRLYGITKEIFPLPDDNTN